jgi:nitrate reductase gamma subunit
LDFIKHNKLEAPNTTAEVVARMFLEVVTFRSLFRNTKSEIYDGPQVTYESSKWLWMFALIFHYSFLLIVIRHMRLFLDPVPAWISWLEFGDGLFQVGAPTWYMTDIGLLLGCVLLFSRRLITRHVRFLSLMNDYFPLVLIFAIALTGILMRYFLRTDIDIVNIKQLAVGLVTFSPTIGAEIGAIFYIHLFLVCALLAYFPFSKLMHFAGVFMSPTRNMKNTSRSERHVNPWNPRILPHSYAGYEDEFREFMVDAGIPVEKELAPKKDEE